MRLWRGQIWLYSVGLAIDLVLLVVSVGRGATAGIVVWTAFSLIMILTLVRIVRNRPFPALTMARIRILRWQAAGLAVGSVVAGTVVVLALPSSYRATAMVLAVVLGLFALLGARMFVVLTRAIGRDEIPWQLKQAFEDRERRRRS